MLKLLVEIKGLPLAPIECIFCERLFGQVLLIEKKCGRKIAVGKVRQKNCGRKIVVGKVQQKKCGRKIAAANS